MMFFSENSQKTSETTHNLKYSCIWGKNVYSGKIFKFMIYKNRHIKSSRKTDTPLKTEENK